MENLNNVVTAVANAAIFNVPVGTVMPYMGSLKKLSDLTGRGWLHCDGLLVDKDKYPELFEVLEFTCGGSGLKFNLPDLRGVFIRGVDDKRRLDPDASKRTKQFSTEVIGDVSCSYQDDALRQHSHSMNAWVASGMRVRNDGTDFTPADVLKPVDTSGTGGLETRPKNFAAYYIIFAGLPK